MPIFHVDPKLFFETNCLIKGSSNAEVVEDLAVAERPPNMRNRSSTFRYRGVAYLADRSATVRYVLYVGSGGDIARYLGGGEDIGKYAAEDRGEDGGKGDVEDRLSIYFQHSSRRCRWSWFFNKKTFSQCLQHGLLHIFSCACRIRRAIKENEVLQSLQWW